MHVQCRVVVVVIVIVGVSTSMNLFARGTGWTRTESGGCHWSGDNTGIDLSVIVIVVVMLDGCGG